ncbi:adenosylcobinamide-phosphate synthase CbiB [Xanthobacter sp. DSM 24535]|uniref:adenosylcobinamide-phosphate synthase CbiB n=1 Tax=Roseixanthobacter psychrophilus TaxID=3119917 RepID=UPI00372A2FC7
MNFLLTFLALAVEATFGYPPRVLKIIGHPVMWIGRLIAILDLSWNRAELSFAKRRRRGVAALLVLLASAAVPAAVLADVLDLFPGGIILTAVLGSALLAQRSLHEHVAAVADALEFHGLDAGRATVSRIVGRDPAQLDEAGVTRAAIESLAENFSDGVVAPAFWMAMAGLPGIAVYKAVNTADSMIGHRTPRHEAFGWAAARFDDLVNLPASRLSGLLIIGAAAFVHGASPVGAWRAVRRDAHKHRSPNAGWPEAAMAGALSISIAGPRTYAGVLAELPFMGDGRREIGAADIRAALNLYTVANRLLMALALLCAILVVIARG